MSDLQADLVKIIVEKGLLGLILAGLAFYVQRALEGLRARNVYYQKLAEEKLAALKEISLIYSQQFVLIGIFSRILDDASPKTAEDEEKMAQDLMNAYNAFAQHYREQAAVLLRCAPLFASQELGKLMAEHQTRVGRIIEMLEDFDAYAKDPIAGPMLSIGESLAAVQNAIAKEMRIPPTGLINGA